MLASSLRFQKPTNAKPETVSAKFNKTDRTQMKKQIIVTIFLTLFVRLLYAQTDTTFNYIDKKFHKCLRDTSGVMGQSFCLGNAVTDWDS